jgi:putative spermidine/putrescine transport system ATP-binding protein
LPVQPDTARPVAVSLRDLRKSFDQVEAVAGVDLDVYEGEFFSMLGPSGSGKTTVLRLIAGFEQPTSGTVVLGGRDVTTAAPFERDVTTVFQDYALFPHMSVLDNVAYGLRVRRVPRSERRERAAEALRTVDLAGMESRRPTQLSGGQRQRVALARALVVDPQVLLLDEPLGALDLKLREQMQVELKEIQRQVGITFLFVTHDQEEALTLSDRIAVFEQGRIQQVGSAEEVYERPATGFVAGFVGTTNLLTGAAARTLLGRDGRFAVRPEKLWLAPGPTPGDPAAGDGLEGLDDLDDLVRAEGTVAEVVYAGSVTRFHVDLDVGARVVVAQQNRHSDPVSTDDLRGTRVRVELDPRSCFTVDTEESA